MNKNWVIKASGNEESITSLARELGVDRPLAQLLIQRNIHTYKEAREFLGQRGHKPLIHYDYLYLG